MSLGHHAVHRADVMRIDHEHVAHVNLMQGDIHNFRFPFTVGD